MTVSAPAPGDRISRLSTASGRKVIEPDIDLPGSVGTGLILPKELLSVADLGLDLTEEQWERLAREELASILDVGVRFESVLMAGFGLMLARKVRLTDPRTTYILHEIGEETRHSRMFLRVIEQLQPTSVNPFTQGVLRAVDWVLTRLVINWPALFVVLVLTGEETPDLIQKRSSEHPDTDPFIRQVNKYHRMEEARHLSFARLLLPELWVDASPVQRWWVRHVAPAMMAGTVDSLVHPGVYETVGLPGWATWKAVARSPSRRQLKAEAFRPILAELVKLDGFGRSVLGRRRVPRAWRKVCLVDGRGGAG